MLQKLQFSILSIICRILHRILLNHIRILCRISTRDEAFAKSFPKKCECPGGAPPPLGGALGGGHLELTDTISTVSK